MAMIARCFVLVLSAFVVSAAPSDFTGVSVEETQALLREWGVHHVLGDEFLNLKYDGDFLALMDESDFDPRLFPRASRLHWKVLLKKIKINQRRRRLAAPVKLDGYVGVRVKNDKSMVALGAKADVKLARTGPKELTFIGDSFIVNGVNLKQKLDDALARIKKLEAGGGGGSSGGGGSKSDKVYEPIKDDWNWVLNANAKWTHSVKDNSITNTAAPHDWLVAGWTGKKFVEKIVRVSIKEIADGKGGGGGGTNWGHPGIAYHYVDNKNWEGFYFRPHSTNSNSAIQFTCTINGKHTYPSTNAAKIPTDGSWFTVAVRVTATQATLKVEGLTWTVNRCAKNVAGGVGVVNHESTSSFQGMSLCEGSKCQLPKCETTCPKGQILDTPCSATSDRTCKNNLIEPIKIKTNWFKNTEGQWTHSTDAGTITNTAAPSAWLIAGWTGANYVEKVVTVQIKEIADGKGGGGGGTNWGHPGIAYHFKDTKNWEGFYFRPHSTNSNSAIQFTCTVNGKTTFPSGNKVFVPTDGSWFTATVHVSSTQAILKVNGLTWTVNRCVKGAAGGVGIYNHQSTSSFRGMMLCQGKDCEIPVCKPCPDGQVEHTPCIGTVPRTCTKNLFEPIRYNDNWSKNSEGKWLHTASANTITNTGAPSAWLIAGWTGRKFIEKNVRVQIQEIPGGGGGGGGTNWGHPGIQYHYLDDKNWEGFYFRPHSTNSNSAIQFTCTVNGKTTFPAGNKVFVPTDGSWFTVSVRVTANQATLIMKGITWTVNRCAKNIPGGVGVNNHQSTSSFRGMLLCRGKDCKLPECKPCPIGQVEDTPCIGTVSAKCVKNYFEPIKIASNWQKNSAGKWVHSASAGTITNTAAPSTWLIAGWTGKMFTEKTVSVDIKEIPGKGGGGGGTNWGHPGIAYHYVSTSNWEGFYFRPHSTNSNSAIQFTCTVNGKATFPGGNKINVPTDGSWFTAKVKVTATQATLMINGLTWTVNRCAKNVAGGVGIYNHQSSSSFKNMRLCQGSNCKFQ